MHYFTIKNHTNKSKNKLNLIINSPPLKKQEKKPIWNSDLSHPADGSVCQTLNCLKKLILTFRFYNFGPNISFRLITFAVYLT